MGRSRARSTIKFHGSNFFMLARGSGAYVGFPDMHQRGCAGAGVNRPEPRERGATARGGSRRTTSRRPARPTNAQRWVWASIGSLPGACASTSTAAPTAGGGCGRPPDRRRHRRDRPDAGGPEGDAARPVRTGETPLAAARTHRRPSRPDRAAARRAGRAGMIRPCAQPDATGKTVGGNRAHTDVGIGFSMSASSTSCTVSVLSPAV